MSTTDQQVFSEVQFALLEPTIDGGVTWTSGLWSASEILNYANQRQYRFVKDTLLLMAYARTDVSAGGLTHSLPDDWIVTYRADWKDGTTGVISELPRTSRFEIDHSNKLWATVNAARPLLYCDQEFDDQYQIMPAPVGAGQVMLLYVSLTAILTGTGEIFTVPDEFVPAIKYGILADMLSKVGRAHDPERAMYCEQRYQEGVEAAKMILNGWGDGELE